MVMARRNRNRSIHTPPKANLQSKKQRQRWYRATQASEGPTIYALQRKAELIGEHVIIDRHGRFRISGETNTSLTTTRLDLALATNQIGNAEHLAGIIYGSMHHALFGNLHPKITSFYAALVHEHLTTEIGDSSRAFLTYDEKEERLEQIKARFDRADDRLKSMPVDLRRSTRALCLDAGECDMDMAVIGLSVLRRHWRIEV